MLLEERFGLSSGGVALVGRCASTPPALRKLRAEYLRLFFATARNLSGVLSALSIAERKEGGVDVHGYNACISGMAKAKRWADALELLQRMRAAGVAPNTACYANAIVVS